MPWKIHPSAIAHVEHLWQPQDNWAEASEHYLPIIVDLVTTLLPRFVDDVPAPRYNWTVKVDDAISLRLGRASGQNFVAYKTSRLPCLDHKHIDHTYPDKSYVASALHHLLMNADSLLGEDDDCSYQVGLLHPACPDDTAFSVPRTVTPNVVTYTFEEAYVENARIAVSVVSRTSLSNGSISQSPEHFSEFGRRGDCIVVRPHAVIPPGQFDPGVRLRSMHDDLELVLSRVDFHAVSGLEPLMRIHLNTCIRKGEPINDLMLSRIVQEFKDFVMRRMVYEAGTRVTEKGKKIVRDRYMAVDERISENEDAVRNAFTLCTTLRGIVEFITSEVKFGIPGVSTDSPLHEGLVVSEDNADGSLTAFKLVPAAFSFENFRKWES